MKWEWVNEYGTICYLNTNKGYYVISEDEDSAFGRLFLELCKNLDDSCTTKAIIISSGYVELEEMQKIAEDSIPLP